MFPQVPTIDLVVINSRDQIDAAAWERLGFTLTSRGFRTLSSLNHSAISRTDDFKLRGCVLGFAE